MNARPARFLVLFCVALLLSAWLAGAAMAATWPGVTVQETFVSWDQLQNTVFWRGEGCNMFRYVVVAGFPPYEITSFSVNNPDGITVEDATSDVSGGGWTSPVPGSAPAAFVWDDLAGGRPLNGIGAGTFRLWAKADSGPVTGSASLININGGTSVTGGAISGPVGNAPEPGTMALLLCGIAGILPIKRLRRRQA